MNANLLGKAFVLVATLAIGGTASGKLIHVDANAPGANNGASWSDAFVYLQDGLAEASSHDRIFVAKGVYRPDQGAGNSLGDQDATFQLKNGVTITGGYAGFGVDDPYERDVENHQTILSGDLAEDDLEILDMADFEQAADREDNSHHIVTADATDPNAVLDGFTIKAGHTGRYDWPRNGGGMCNVGGSPSLRQCTFVENWGRFGGGVYNENGSPKFTDCHFYRNGAERGGGFNAYDSNSVLVSCTFTENWADDFGGGAYLWEGESVLDGCTLTDNRGENSKGGGMYVLEAHVTVNQCDFTGNYAQQGGALAGYADSEGIIADCNFVGNSSYWSGAALHGFDGDIADCIISDNEAGSSGGGLSECNGKISNCQIVRNRANSVAGGMEECDGEIVGCTISDNWAKYNTGGMLSCEGSITDCVIQDNTCGDTGGGLNGCDGPITGCIVSGNYAKYAGGGLHNCTGPIKNCIIVGNASWQGGGLQYCSGGIINCTIFGNRAEFDGSAYSVCNGLITNCIIWGNQDDVSVRHLSSLPTYCCVQNGSSGTGCFEADPQFIEPGYWDSNDTPGEIEDDYWVLGDFHIKSQVGRWDPVSQRWETDATDSPCIDTGDPNSDWTAELWSHGKRINVGAYGGTPQASMSHSTLGNVADFNCDGSVNAEDLLMFAERWTSDALLLKEDITRNGLTNFPDFAIFAENWLWEQ